MVDRSEEEMSAWEVWDPWRAAILGGHPCGHCYREGIATATELGSDCGQDHRIGYETEGHRFESCQARCVRHHVVSCDPAHAATRTVIGVGAVEEMHTRARQEAA